MTPQYQVNLGTIDPLLGGYNNPQDYQAALEREMARLNYIKEMNNSKVNENNVWDDIERELSSLNDDQKQILFSNKEYIAVDTELQLLVQKELLKLVKYKISNSSIGKELLEKQLNIIKTNKSSIIEKSNAELELFKTFQKAAQSNPNLTYLEFVKSIKEQ